MKDVVVKVIREENLSTLETLEMRQKLGGITKVNALLEFVVLTFPAIFL